MPDWLFNIWTNGSNFYEFPDTTPAGFGNKCRADQLRSFLSGGFPTEVFGVPDKSGKRFSPADFCFHNFSEIPARIFRQSEISCCRSSAETRSPEFNFLASWFRLLPTRARATRSSMLIAGSGFVRASADSRMYRARVECESFAFFWTVDFSSGVIRITTETVRRARLWRAVS